MINNHERGVMAVMKIVTPLQAWANILPTMWTHKHTWEGLGKIDDFVPVHKDDIDHIFYHCYQVKMRMAVVSSSLSSKEKDDDKARAQLGRFGQDWWQRWGQTTAYVFLLEDGDDDGGPHEDDGGNYMMIEMMMIIIMGTRTLVIKDYDIDVR